MICKRVYPPTNVKMFSLTNVHETKHSVCFLSGRGEKHKGSWKKFQCRALLGRHILVNSGKREMFGSKRYNLSPWYGMVYFI